MGGSSYDRDVYSSTSSSGWGGSTTAAKTLTKTKMDSSLDPKNKTLKSNAKNPIMIMLDVTGSNIDLARLFYDKAPMFYGQIEQQGYLKDFELVICAVGDAYSDDYSLQVGSFAKGKDIDPWIEKLVLEGGGGGQHCESYELAACYLLKKTEFANGAKPIVFFIADEAPYSRVDSRQAQSNLGVSYGETTKHLFNELREKFGENVFVLLNKYSGDDFVDSITAAWQNIMAPEHVIKINEGKSVVDLMLGIIAMASNARDLDAYVDDMSKRGQTVSRINNIKDSLGSLERSLVPVTVSGALTTHRTAKRSTNNGTRLGGSSPAPKKGSSSSKLRAKDESGDPVI
jgi:hypothetical protein